LEIGILKNGKIKNQIKLNIGIAGMKTRNCSVQYLKNATGITLTLSISQKKMYKYKSTVPRPNGNGRGLIKILQSQLKLRATITTTTKKNAKMDW